MGSDVSSRITMPVFISYTHADKHFVDLLAVNLVDARVSVWLDRWELNVGDSLIEKIQDGLQDASALLVVLSKASLESQWCKKELSVGLLRELEERKVVVLPILLEDCSIPLLLRDKVYADFRSNFDEGWHSVISAIAGVTSLDMGRIDDDTYHTDWAEDWGSMDGHAIFNYTLVQASNQWKHTIMTQITVIATEESTRRYERYVAADLDWYGRFIVLASIIEAADDSKMRVMLEDSFPKSRDLTVFDPKADLGYSIRITARRMGEDTGKDILVDCSGMLRTVYEQTAGRMRQPTLEELNRLTEIAFNHNKS